jgi:Plant transposon protein
MSVKQNKLLSNNTFYLKKKNDNNQIVSVKYNSAWFMCDNGYPEWSCLIPPMKDPIYFQDYRFSEWIESMRKDVECTFGIMKGRFRVLKTGVRLHGIGVTDKIWLTCCALHNFFLHEDGLSEAWDTTTNIWETDYSDHDPEYVNNYAPDYIIQNTTNLATLDLSGMGPGTDNQWPDDNTNMIIEEEQNDNGNHNDNNLIVDNDLNTLSYETFRAALVEHLNILHEQKLLVWPKRMKEVQMHYN